MTESLPLISVCIPAYNHELFIENCLDSILRDDYPRKEVVILNDGSTDGTDASIRRWIKHNGTTVHVSYRSRPNRGAVPTFNELIDMVCGEYIVWLASDDYLLNNGIGKRYEYLRVHSRKLAVFGDCIVVDKDNRTVLQSGIADLHKGNKDGYHTDAGLRHEIITKWAVPGPVLMVNKDIYRVIGKYDENLSFEDWDFYLRMSARDLLGFLDEVVSAYRIHGDNLCRKDKSHRTGVRYVRKVALKNIGLFSLTEQYFLAKKIFGSTLYLWGVRDRPRKD